MTCYLSSFAIPSDSIATCIPYDRQAWNPDDVLFLYQIPDDMHFPSFHQIPDDRQLDNHACALKNASPRRTKRQKHTLSTTLNPMDGRMLGKFHFFS